MRNYREYISKGSCLFNAIIWTLLPFLHLSLFFYRGAFFNLDLKSTWYGVLLLIVEVSACTVHWYRYLAYDKKTTGGKQP